MLNRETGKSAEVPNVRLKLKIKMIISLRIYLKLNCEKETTTVENCVHMRLISLFIDIILIIICTLDKTEYDFFQSDPLCPGGTTELMPQNRNFDTTPCLGSKRTIVNDIGGHNETVDLMFQENNTPKKQ